MKTEKTQAYMMILLVAFVAIFAVGIAYAALSQALTITTNKVTQKAQTWEIAFDTTNTSVSATISPTGTYAPTCGAATVTANSITVADIQLQKPNDSCLYTFTIKNSGTIAAKLTSLTANLPTVSSGGITCIKTDATTSAGATITCADVVYSITTDTSGTTPLKVNDSLAASSNRTIYLLIKYQDVDSVRSNDIVHTGATFNFTYGQA